MSFCKNFLSLKKTAWLVGGFIKHFHFWCIISSFLLLGSIWLSISSIFFRCYFFALDHWLDHIFNYLTEDSTCGLCLLSANIAIENSLCFSPILVSCNLTIVISGWFISHWQNLNIYIEWEVHFRILRNLCGARSVQFYVVLEKETCNLCVKVDKLTHLYCHVARICLIHS